jgi:hypothetical protein
MYNTLKFLLLFAICIGATSCTRETDEEYYLRKAKKNPVSAKDHVYEQYYESGSKQSQGRYR